MIGWMPEAGGKVDNCLIWAVAVVACYVYTVLERPAIDALATIR